MLAKTLNKQNIYHQLLNTSAGAIRCAPSFANTFKGQNEIRRSLFSSAVRTHGLVSMRTFFDFPCLGHHTIVRFFKRDEWQLNVHSVYKQEELGPTYMCTLKMCQALHTKTSCPDSLDVRNMLKGGKLSYTNGFANLCKATGILDHIVLDSTDSACSRHSHASSINSVGFKHQRTFYCKVLAEVNTNNNPRAERVPFVNAPLPS